MALIPPSAALECSLCLQQGAEDYGAFNWREDPIEFYEMLHALQRHFNSVLDREDIDPKSKRKHLGHIMATCAILIDAEAHGTLIDNRPPAGRGAELIRAAIKHPVESHDTTALHDDLGAVLVSHPLPTGKQEGRPVVGGMRRAEQTDSDR
jgi:hypothetical protein